jgi:(2R)-ethylmalonyl-CoA mutase
MGGAIAAIETSYMKRALVESNTARLEAHRAGRSEGGWRQRYTESEPSPLAAGADGGILTIDEGVAEDQIGRLNAWREQRDSAAADAALADLKSAAQEGRNIMEPSIVCRQGGRHHGRMGRHLA